MDDLQIDAVVENFINGNKKDALAGMKEIKNHGQEIELVDKLYAQPKHQQLAILEYFYKYC